MRRLLTTAVLAALLPAAAVADANLALALGFERYEKLDRLPSGDDPTGALDAVDALDFDVIAVANAGRDEALQALNAFTAAAPEADRLLVALSGRFVTDGSRTWVLSSNANVPSLFSLGHGAISIESVLAVLARNPARSVLLLGVDPNQTDTFDPWLSEGIGALEIPQGVTVLTAPPAELAAFMEDSLAVPRGDLSRLVAEDGRIRGEGYLPRGFTFMPREAAAPAAPAEPQPPAPDLAAESALWEGARALDTVESYRNYIRAYPRGRYAAEAEAAIVSILSDPNRDARLAEDLLRLSRDQRRAIQRDLALLEFDPRGIDGIFGQGTRRAIANWQQQNGFAQTSYLTAEQAARLEAQAARRAAQIETEDERRREALLAADRAYWEETGEGHDEAGLRAYLDRYPDGRYAEDAADGLALIAEDRRRRAEAEERALWDAVRDSNTPAAYQGYLEDYPEGGFAEEARQRRDALLEREGAGDEAAAQAARAAEEALGLNALTARVVEQRLEALGMDPGRVDGEFDRDTRRALLAYQRDRGLPAVGFLNEPTLVRLLADTLSQALGD